MVSEERPIRSIKGGTMMERLRQVDRMAWLLLFLRVGLGGLFITSSIAKFQHPDLFIDAVLSYHLLPKSLAEFYGTVLPWVELFVGCSLILGIFNTLSTGIGAAMTLSFIIANIYSMFHPGATACGCLGQLVLLSHPVALTIDFVMLAAAGLLLYARDRAGYLGVGRLLARGKDTPGLPRAAMFILGVVTVVLAMIVAVALMGGTGDSVRGEVDAALKDYDAVVVFFYNGDPTGYVIIYELEQQYQSVHFIRVDCMDDPAAAEDYNIDTFPTVLVITRENKKGIALVGPVDKDALTATIEEALSGSP